MADGTTAIFETGGEESKVSDVLMDLVRERVDERVNSAVNAAVSATVIDARRRTRVEVISRLAKSEGWSLERAMDLLEIPQDERFAYVEAVTAVPRQ